MSVCRSKNRQISSTISFMVYNVAGLKSKLNDQTSVFLQFLKKHNIFVLLETFIDDKFDYYSTFFDGYCLCWVPATRQAQFGRAMGGKLYAIRSNLPQSQVKFLDIDNVKVIYIKSQIEFYILPVYLCGKSWDLDFSNLASFLEKNSHIKFALTGDFNARIADSQSLSFDVILDNPNCNLSRKSRDRVINSRGARLLELCDDHDFIILNGRFNDIEGEFTFCGGVGKSVIDFICFPIDCISCIVDFKVLAEPFRIIYLFFASSHL